ncbi:MAG: hypothetical protein COV52_07820 [Gammaproteobacteria bacterium CG11_big_fil_rev_8_21_14_0_20_46_22]|nr:MAG: hypothetical protein COW05_03900 [Gammaproteobacteria bacterium CG12_big_fil_rev_8_21_14_0_65_46_12]PIR10664.1 MAG: hypothetical protein COV52_07820 [Gammaproteobacteria bacterium CG11_big_fil_rev_8_21_14_0_20_46_22]
MLIKETGAIVIDYPDMMVGRFCLKAGDVIPHHLHKGQYALTYLLSGKSRVNCYAHEKLSETDYCLTLASSDVVIANQAMTLTPELNVHSIAAIEDSVFLDVFSPGKQDGEGVTVFFDIVENRGETLLAKVMPKEQVSLPEDITQFDRYSV